MSRASALYYLPRHIRRGPAACRLYDVDTRQYGVRIGGCGFGDVTLDSIRRGSLETSAALLRCPLRHSGVKWGNSKIPSVNSGLERNLDHDRVLFVQHPLE